ASSYSQLLAILTPNYAAFSIPDGTPVTIDISASAGPNFTFYVVVPSSVIDKFQSGVYADFSFADWQDPLVAISDYGGFFNPNPGEVSAAALQQNKRLFKIIDSMKAAGTNGILV